MNCKKCGAIGSIIIRKEHMYCVECFMHNVNHKFRACIGKNKILSANEKVLVCLTGGQSSTVLLDLIFNGLTQDSHKKLRIIPSFLHLTGFGDKESNLKTADAVIKQCRRYNFNVYIINIRNLYFKNNNSLPDQNATTEITNYTDNDSKSNIDNILKQMTPTSSNDIEKRLKLNAFIKVADELKCKYIFTAETTTTLAINLLSNLAIGRGSQVEVDVGFCDDRHENIKILRPMKDITEEEIQYYIELKDLSPVNDNHLKNNSLQSVIKTFVSDLQQNFPATISTVCKTASKIRSSEMHPKRCQLCKSHLSQNNDQMTAIEATIFSRTVSNCQPSDYSDIDQNINERKSMLDHQNHTMSMFPHIDKHLCYSCSKTYLESGLHNIFQINESL